MVSQYIYPSLPLHRYVRPPATTAAATAASPISAAYAASCHCAAYLCDNFHEFFGMPLLLRIILLYLPQSNHTAAMLCYAVLCYAMLCCAVLCCAVSLL